MIRTLRGRVNRDGFTLVEVLVTLLLIGLLVGVILPSVIGQSSKGENQRVVDDLQAIRSASKMFRLDVQRWPSRLDQLSNAPATWADSTDLLGNPIPNGLLGKWNGPYLERGVVSSPGITTALGGVILMAFDTVYWGGTPFLRLKTDSLQAVNAEAISAVVDGDTVTTTGRVRFIAPDTLAFLATPINN